MHTNLGYPYRQDWVSAPKTAQQKKADLADFFQADTHHPDKFPRGRAAARMLDLGWEFNK